MDTEPDFPVIVVGINERGGRNQLNSQQNNNSLEKSAAYDPQLFLEWVNYLDDHEPWIKGKAEVEMLVLTGLDYDLRIRWTGVVERWYHHHQYLYNMTSQVGRYIGVKFYETDGGGSMSVSIDIDEDYFQAHASFEMSDGDDFMGENLLIDLAHGPLVEDRNIQPNVYYAAGDVRFTLWWIPNFDPEFYNPGFEGGGVWDFINPNPSTGCIVERTTSDKNSGSYSLYIRDVSLNHSCKATQLLDYYVVGSRLYKITGNYKHEFGSQQKMTINWYTFNMNLITSEQMSIPAFSSWNGFDFWALAPDNAAQMKIIIGTDNNTIGGGYFDDFSIDLID